MGNASANISVVGAALGTDFAPLGVSSTDFSTASGRMYNKVTTYGAFSASDPYPSGASIDGSRGLIFVRILS